MDLWEATKILFRRWYVTIPVAVLAVFGAYVAGSQVAPEYVASSVAILLPIDEGGEDAIFTVEDAENPWEQVGAVPTLRAVALVLTAEDARSQIVDQGLAPTYSIEVEPKDPIVYLDVTDRDPALALVTLDELILRFEDELDARQSQAQAPEGRRFRVDILSQSEAPLPDFGSRTRIRIIVLLLGLVLAAAAALIYDAWATARDERDAAGDHAPGGLRADRSDEPGTNGATEHPDEIPAAEPAPVGAGDRQPATVGSGTASGRRTSSASSSR